MRYVLDFGAANAGGSPTWIFFARVDTWAALTQPTIVESPVGNGAFYFDFDFATAPAGVSSVSFKATCGGVELSDVISGVAPVGSISITPSGPTEGYSTAGQLIGRAATQAGVLALTPSQVAIFDPFASTNPAIIQFIEWLRRLGDDLAGEVKAHLHKEGQITTAGSATTYDMPIDYVEMVDGSGWDRTTLNTLLGPVSPQYDQFLQAWSDGAVCSIPYRLRGPRITFPVAPQDGLDIRFEYVSRYWIASAGALGGDKSSPTLMDDVVLFDEGLILLGLDLAFREAKGFDTTTAAAKYAAAVEYEKGRTAGGATLSLNGRPYGQRLLDIANLPATPWGI